MIESNPHQPARRERDSHTMGDGAARDQCWVTGGFSGVTGGSSQARSPRVPGIRSRKRRLRVSRAPLSNTTS